MSTIGERITALRERRGMSQIDLAEAIGESKQTIYKYEKGIVTNIPLEKIEKIAKALRCPPVVLTGWEEGPKDNVELSERHKALISLYNSLTPEAQDLVYAQLLGIMQSQKGRDDP